MSNKTTGSGKHSNGDVLVAPMQLTSYLIDRWTNTLFGNVVQFAANWIVIIALSHMHPIQSNVCVFCFVLFLVFGFFLVCVRVFVLFFRLLLWCWIVICVVSFYQHRHLQLLQHNTYYNSWFDLHCRNLQMKWWAYSKLSVVLQSLEIAMLIRTKETHLLRT